MLLAVGSTIAAVDDRVLLWLSGLLSKSPLFDKTVGWLNSAPLTKFAPITMLACWLWFRNDPQQQNTRRILLEAAIAGLAALVAGRLLALALPFRERPFLRPELHFNVPDFGLRTWSAFPSDHAVMAFALSASLFRISPLIGTLAALHSVIVICLPRAYFGLHHPSDLAGGALIGVLMAFVIARLPARHAVTDPLMRIERLHPSAFYGVGFLLLFEITEMFESFHRVAVGLFRFLLHGAV